jgi:uncharacterized membrane protein YjfL (UPF0719 family)
MMKQWRQAAWGMAGVVLMNAMQVWAQTGTPAATRNIGASVLSTIVFGLLGILLAIIGFKLFDIVVKFDLEKEICEKQNLAASILCGFMVLGICLIVAATVLS